MEPTGSDVLGDGATGLRSARSWTVWVVRIAWVALAVTASAIGDAVSGADRAVQLVTAVACWTAWALVLLALLVPTTVSLTVVRLLTPAAPVVLALALLAGAPTGLGITGLVIGLVAAIAAFVGETGETFVQGSAYGAERRLLLRAPAPLVPALVAFWSLLVAGAIGGPLLAASADGRTGRLLVGIAVCLLTVGLARLLVPRFQVLAHRWLVLVPAGLVVHDPLLLADTFMVPTGDIAAVSLAYEDTEAADVTGNALGPAVEIALTGFQTIVLAADRAHPGGRALHVQSLLVSPTRPGRALAAWAARS